MAIVRITRRQIEQAVKAREAALLKDKGFRLHDEQLRSVVRATAATKEAMTREREQPS